MKNAYLIILATLLTGCAGPNAQRFAQGFADGLQYQSAMAQQRAQQPQMDLQCFNSCTQAGHMHGFCKSKCSY